MVYEPSLKDTDEGTNPNDPLSFVSLTKTQFMEARETISQIENLLTEARNKFYSIPFPIQATILIYHNDPATLQHCLRWGLQAAKEIRSDWHMVVAGLPCGERKEV